MNHPAHNDEGNGGGNRQPAQRHRPVAQLRLHPAGPRGGSAERHQHGAQLGITRDLPEFPSIVIGSVAVHPIEMAAAYAAVADNGVYHAPSFIDHIVDRSGATIYDGRTRATR